MAGADKPVEQRIGGVEDRFQGRDDGDMVAKYREVFNVFTFSLEDGQRGTRDRGFKTQTEKNDFFIGLFTGKSKRIQR